MLLSLPHITEGFELRAGFSINLGGQAGPLVRRSRFQLSQKPTTPNRRTAGVIVGLDSIIIVAVEFDPWAELRRQGLNHLPSATKRSGPGLSPIIEEGEDGSVILDPDLAVIPEEHRTRHRLPRVNTAQIQDCGQKIDVLDGCRYHLPGAGRVGEPNHQRNRQYLVVEIETVGPAPVFTKCLAVIGREYDHRVFELTEGIEIVEQSAEAGVVGGNLGVVEIAKIPAELGRWLHRSEDKPTNRLHLTNRGIPNR